MQNMAERLADNAHDIWAKKKKEELLTVGMFQDNSTNISNFKNT